MDRKFAIWLYKIISPRLTLHDFFIENYKSNKKMILKRNRWWQKSIGFFFITVKRKNRVSLLQKNCSIGLEEKRKNIMPHAPKLHFSFIKKNI